MAQITLKSRVKNDACGLVIDTTAIADGNAISMRCSISVGKNTVLAARLCRAIDAGVVFTDLKVMRDVYGESYLDGRCKVIGRHLNADLLTRLGF